MSLAAGQVLEMKPAENVWDAIAADLAAVTAATSSPDEIAAESVGAETQSAKGTEPSDKSGSLQAETCVKESQDGTGKAASKELQADTRSDKIRDSSGMPVVDEAQGGVKVGDEPNPDSVVCKEEAAEMKDGPSSAQNVIETLTDSTEEDGNNHTDDAAEQEEKEDKGENILGKRNRESDVRVTRSAGKKLKVQVPLSGDAGESSQREQRDGTTPYGETLPKAPELRHIPDWNEPHVANLHALHGLGKLHRVFTSLNTACGFLLKQQRVASWQNVKQAMEQLSGGDGEAISVEDVRRLAQLCPRIVVLSQFSGEGEDISFHIELFDPADAGKVDPPGSTNGTADVDAQGNITSDHKSAGKEVSDSEAKVIVERRQKAFQMAFAQITHQFQVPGIAGERPFGDIITNIRSLAPQSSSIPLGGDERIKLPAMLPHPAMRPPLLGLPSQQLGLIPPPPFMPQQLQHGFMNMSGGYPGIPFPLPPVQPTNAHGPYGSFHQPPANNYAGYQLSSLVSAIPSSLPSTSQLSSMPLPHRSQPTITPPVAMDVPEAPAAPETSPYHGLSLNKAKRRRSRNWDTWEVILLVQAKKNEWERSESSSGRDRFETSGERWKKVEKFLKENKVVDRDAIACKNKWESILSDYKSIKDWNRKPGNTVYSLLSPAEKRSAALPAIFASSLLELMDTFQGKSSHVSPPSVVDSLARTNPAASGGGGAASGEDASGAEDSGEAHRSGAHGGGEGTHGSAGRRKKSNGSSSPLVAAFDRLSANMLNIEKGRDERSERIWALENRKYDLERSKFELQARKIDAEREDRKGLIRVLGNLAGAFHRMADKM